MTHTDQLEQEAEFARGELTGTLDQLRTRMSVGQILDEVMDYTRTGAAGEFAGNLRSQAMANPVPLVLMGAGMAWMMFAASKGPSSHHDIATRDSKAAEARDRVSPPDWGGVESKASSTADKASSLASTAAAGVRNGAQAVGGSLSAAGGYLKDGAEQGRDTARRTYYDVTDAVSDTAQQAARVSQNLASSTASVSQRFMAFCKEQPLVLAGLGLAIGAGLGALLPNTDTENNAMGEAAEDAKTHLADAAGGAMDKATAVAESALTAAMDEAQKQGLAAPADQTAEALEKNENGEAALPPSPELTDGQRRQDPVH
ncbi:DUF3618 domain-containing protein [Aquabacter sp. CN5-332]|uniref:DUF3618 domain-containing protein n=1 Tax=Aquabacter sp. CN5-332 TaxID=3156608 RepID=UPI0032B37F82